MRRQTSRNPLFRRRRFADDMIILCVRWYLRFKLSYRGMAEVAWELGVLVPPSTILRWVGALCGGLQPALASIRETGRRIVAV
jgi:transposase-like protein